MEEKIMKTIKTRRTSLLPLVCLLAISAFAPAAHAQTASSMFALSGDLQSLTDSSASWGRDPLNSRFNPFARINRQNVNQLQLKWTFVFPDGVTSASSQPARLARRDDDRSRRGFLRQLGRQSAGARFAQRQYSLAIRHLPLFCRNE